MTKFFQLLVTAGSAAARHRRRSDNASDDKFDICGYFTRHLVVFNTKSELGNSIH
jgi:hypothetical protein